MPHRNPAALSGIVLALLLSIARGSSVAAQADEGAGSTDHTARIARVESSLIRPYQIEGRPEQNHMLEEMMAFYGVPGLSIAVIDGGELAWEKGYGVRDVVSGEPVTPETLFQAASISKPVAVMGLLRLVEEGRVDLDTDVNRYLKSWKVRNPYDEPVTLRRLASHTAGTTVHGFPGYERADRGRPGTVGVLRGEGNTATVRVDLEPGSRYRYSGGGTTILQLVMEEVTGRPFEEYMRDAVLRPAGMLASTYAQPLPENRWDEAASGHLASGSRVAGGWHVYPEKAAAGLWTTPSDLARLALEVQRSLRGEANNVLSREMAVRMLEPVEGTQALGFGSIPPQGGRFSHDGANAGFRASFLAFADGRAVIVMTNGDHGHALYPMIQRAVARAYGWEEIGRPEPVTLAELPDARGRALARTYTIPAWGGGVFELTVRDDGLYDMTSSRLPPSVLAPVADAELLDLSNGVRLKVEWSGDRVERLRMPNGIEIVPK